MCERHHRGAHQGPEGQCLALTHTFGDFPPSLWVVTGSPGLCQSSDWARDSAAVAEVEPTKSEFESPAAHNIEFDPDAMQLVAW